jgi:hypothetical protein
VVSRFPLNKEMGESKRNLAIQEKKVGTVEPVVGSAKIFAEKTGSVEWGEGGGAEIYQIASL